MHHFLNAAMLVTQLYLEIQDLLSVALKTEMTRLDDSRMYRAHRHLVHFLALDAVEIHNSHNRRFGFGAVAMHVGDVPGAGTEPG